MEDLTSSSVVENTLKVFGWQHLTYLAVFIMVSVVCGFLIVKYAKEEKALSLTMHIIGYILLALIIFNRFAIVAREGCDGNTCFLIAGVAQEASLWLLH